MYSDKFTILGKC